jgi:hypothetical protein
MRVAPFGLAGEPTETLMVRLKEDVETILWQKDVVEKPDSPVFSPVNEQTDFGRGQRIDPYGGTNKGREVS